MRRLISILLLTSLSSYAQDKSCEYGESNTCPKDYYCAKIDKNKDRCLLLPKEIPIVSLPFATGQKVTCFKSVILDRETTHAYDQSRFAIDLYSPYGENANVFSVIAGTAFINDECDQGDSPSCGAGFGNSVKIIGENGIMAFYVHLDKVFVKSGQKIGRGELLGEEGMTGNTGKEPKTSPRGFKHLHFSLHRYAEWGRRYDNEPFPAFSSIPFKLKVVQDGEKKVIDVRDFPCHYYGNQKTPVSSDWD